MPYTSLHRMGGLKVACWIECAGCGATTGEHPRADDAWADAESSGWVRQASYPLAPKCPACNEYDQTKAERNALQAEFENVREAS